MNATPQQLFGVTTRNRGLVAYIDVDKELWWAPANEDSESRMEVVARHASDLVAVLVGGTGGMTTEKLKRGIDTLVGLGVEPSRIGSFTLRPELAPADAGFISCPVLLNRSPVVAPFDIYLRAFPRLWNAPLVLTYGYLLIAPADETSVGRALQVEVVRREDATALAAYSSLAASLGLRVLALETGSGSAVPIDAATVRQVRNAYPHYLIVGGGVRSAEEVSALLEAGANAVNIGDILEKTPSAARLLNELCAAARTF